MISDALTAIIAGYDTTASVLSALFYFVLRDREIYSHLQGEVDAYFQSADVSQLDSSRLTSLPYMNAVMLVIPTVLMDL